MEILYVRHRPFPRRADGTINYYKLQHGRESPGRSTGQEQLKESQGVPLRRSKRLAGARRKIAAKNLKGVANYWHSEEGAKTKIVAKQVKEVKSLVNRLHRKKQNTMARTRRQREREDADAAAGADTIVATKGSAMNVATKGSAKKVAQQNGKKKAEVEVAQQRVKKANVAAGEAQHESLKAEVEAKGEEIEQLKDKMAEQLNQIEELQQEKKKLNDAIKQLEDKVVEQLEQNEELQQQMKEDLQHMEKEKKELNDTIKTLKEDLKSKPAAIARSPTSNFTFDENITFKNRMITKMEKTKEKIPSPTNRNNKIKIPSPTNKNNKNQPESRQLCGQYHLVMCGETECPTGLLVNQRHVKEEDLDQGKLYLHTAFPKILLQRKENSAAKISFEVKCPDCNLLLNWSPVLLLFFSLSDQSNFSLDQIDLHEKDVGLQNPTIFAQVFGQEKKEGLWELLKDANLRVKFRGTVNGKQKIIHSGLEQLKRKINQHHENCSTLNDCIPK